MNLEISSCWFVCLKKWNVFVYVENFSVWLDLQHAYHQIPLHYFSSGKYLMEVLNNFLVLFTIPIKIRQQSRLLTSIRYTSSGEITSLGQRNVNQTME